jgi:large subunit ribosomal protein L5
MSKKEEKPDAGAKPAKKDAPSKAKGGGEPKTKKEKGTSAAERKGPEGDEPNAASEPAQPAPPPRLRERYLKDVVPQLMSRFHYRNRMQVPRLQKIVLNVGLGAAVQNPKLLDSTVEEVAQITGQKPVITKARKSIANFKLREGMSIGVTVPSGASACGSSWTAWSVSDCRGCATSAGSARGRSTGPGTTRSG